MRRAVLAGIVCLLTTFGLLVTNQTQGSFASTTDPATLIENVPATTSVYGLHDSAGHTMDTAKVVTSPAGGYLAVYHYAVSGGYNVAVATSTNLRTWTFKRVLDTAGSQPYLAFSNNSAKGPLLVDEAFSPSHLRFKYWTTLSGMLGTTAPYITFDAPKTLSTCAEGTPDVRSFTIPSGGYITNSTIVIGHHYFSGCSTDREALGKLVNFKTWTTTAQSAIDQRLTNAGAVGKHGDRDHFVFNGVNYTLYEGGSTTASAMGDWRNYLDDGTTARKLNIHTKGGSTAFANPSVTLLNDPNKVPSILVTEFIPSQGAAAGESGELLYWQPVDAPAPSTSASATVTPTPTVSVSPTPTDTVTPTPTITPSQTITPTPTVTPPASEITKVLTFIEENHSLSQMQSGMPYLYSQAQQYGYATNWIAATHPSLPNYLALAGGSTFGIADDSNPSSHPISGPDVFSAAIKAGKTAKSYQEDMTSNCMGTSTGNYAPKHNPWAYFTDGRSYCSTYDIPSGTVTSGNLHNDVVGGTLPTVGEVTPNLCNDAHDCSLATADAWLKNWLELIYTSPDWKSGHLAVVVTADEDDRNSGNKVLTTVIAPTISHEVVTTPLTHYSWTRYMTELTGASCIANGCSATSMKTAFNIP